MKKVIGAGSPVVDFLAQVSEEFVAHIEGEKGGMELISAEVMETLIAELDAPPVRAPGGSAGNTIFALARMGIVSAFLGMLGDDGDGTYYRQRLESAGGDASRFKTTADAPTARCLSLITPDSERTMRTDLGAAMHLMPEHLTPEDFEGFSLLHAEGYLLFNPDLATAVLKNAKAAGCKISLDLGSFEVVRAAETVLHQLLEDYVDLVFANEDEAEAFCGHADPEKALREFGARCEVAAVKLGADGALLLRDGESCHAPIIPVDTVIDTTGAGDCWAAGFLYGWLTDQPLPVCGELGALLGGEVVRCIGASPEPASWERIRARIAQL
jgi:sugar/nucleoside kinase (ribokinase family)